MTERLLSLLIRYFEILDLLGKSETVKVVYSGTQLSVLCFAQIKPFTRCECDPSAEWNSSTVGRRSLIEACS